jgi:hypothetical protein
MNSKHAPPAVQIELPRTPTRRGANASLTLIESIDLDPRIPLGIAWQGRRYRTGLRIPEADLFRSCRANRLPLVLEQTELVNETVRAGRRHRWRLVLILWQFDRETHDWHELARMFPPCSYQETELRKLGARALGQDSWRDLESVAESADRIQAYLADEIYRLGPRRGPVLDLVLRELVGRLVLEHETVSIPRFRPGRTDVLRACGLRAFG